MYGSSCCGLSVSRDGRRIDVRHLYAAIKVCAWVEMGERLAGFQRGLTCDHSLDTRLYFCGPPVRNVSSFDASAACHSDIAGCRLGYRADSFRPFREAPWFG